MFMPFHGVFLGNQHASWSQQHKGKSDNIHDLSYGLEDMLKRNPGSFTYKPDMRIPGP